MATTAPVPSQIVSVEPVISESPAASSQSNDKVVEQIAEDKLSEPNAPLPTQNIAQAPTASPQSTLSPPSWNEAGLLDALHSWSAMAKDSALLFSSWNERLLHKVSLAYFLVMIFKQDFASSFQQTLLESDLVMPKVVTYANYD